MREHEAIDLGHHPGADREICAVQPKDDERSWEREQCGHNARDGNGEQRIDAAEQREREQEVAAEPDKGLLADRNQAGVACEQIPALRERQHVEQEDQVLNQGAACEDRKQHQDQQHDTGGKRGGA